MSGDWVTPRAEAPSLQDLPSTLSSLDVEIVLIDVGGVLADDVWERMLLDPEQGLATRRDIDARRLRDIGARLWQVFCHKPTQEADWWTALEAELGLRVDAPERDELRALIRGNPASPGVFRALADAGLAVGVVSNNTSFWYPLQLDLAGVAPLVLPDLRLMSCDAGVSKGDRPGLYELAARKFHGRRIAVVDDRDPNLGRARELGLVAVQARFGTALDRLR